MKQATLDAIFTKDYLDTLMPEETSDQFFKALYRDSSDGAYDIRLKFISANDKRIVLAFSLIQWPGKCLVSNLTYGRYMSQDDRLQALFHIIFYNIKFMALLFHDTGFS